MSNAIASAVCSAASATIAYIIMKRRRKRRRNRVVWTRQWIADRMQHGAYNTLMVHMRHKDIEGFINFLRMDPCTFDELTELVAPHIQRQDTRYRKAISPGKRLSVTLRFLASGMSKTHEVFTFSQYMHTASIGLCMPICFGLLHENYTLSNTTLSIIFHTIIKGCNHRKGRRLV